MLTTIALYYLGVGLVLVAVFHNPIKDKVEDAYLFGCIFGGDASGLTWRLIAFTVLLVTCCAVLWPLYLLVVWAVWDGKRPMTNREIREWIIARDAWEKKREERRNQAGKQGEFGHDTEGQTGN